MVKVLVVEDDKAFNQTVCSFLIQNGYRCVGCMNAMAAFDAMETTIFDLVISDIMMPGMDGFMFVQEIRAYNETMPIIFMTAREDMAAKTKGFRIGVDDYMVKPVQLDELLLRMEAVLRRAKIATSRRLEVGSFCMDADARTAYLGEKEIGLTSREFDILYRLLSYPGKTFTRGQLMDAFWDADTETAPRAVDVYMTKIRSKLSGCQAFALVTVHGLGYKVVIEQDG